MKTAAKNMPLEIVTPERAVFKGEVLFGVFPGTEGELGILPGHIHLLTSLGAGEVRLQTGDGARFLAVSAGFLEIGPHGISVLAETAEPAEDIDILRAERAREQAIEEMAREPSGDEYAQAVARLARAQARLKTAESAGRIKKTEGERS